MASRLDKNYLITLNNLKDKIKLARLRAGYTVNIQLLQLYWEIGNTILLQRQKEGWGTNVVGRLAKDLRSEFPDMKGLSQRNLVYMQTFAGAWTANTFTQQAVAKLRGKQKINQITQQAVAQIGLQGGLQPLIAKLPWGHHVVILDKLETTEERLFYIKKCIDNGWSRSTLMLQIESKLHKRQGKAITNFDNTLPPAQSDLAKETFKNPYLFDFLNVGEEMQEREMEKVLLQHIKKFLLELGRGFAYVGNQFNIPVAEDDYFLDLLFYNYHLHCFIVFELKIGKFKPEYAGKLNFYINTVDEQVKGREDKSTIGVLLCKTSNHTTVKYALKGIKTPMGVADYEFAKALPKNIKTELPSIEELEAVFKAKAKKTEQPLSKKVKKIQKVLHKSKNKNNRRRKGK